MTRGSDDVHKPEARGEDRMSEVTIGRRLDGLEARLERLETLLGAVAERLERPALDAEAMKQGIQAWVTDYVSLRLQQLVPETCEHPAELEGTAVAAPQCADVAGPVIPGTRVRCTDEVLHRLGRIPIPFVRQMVAQKVAETARTERVPVVDVTFFERAATF
jgi:hypothetical protein